MPHRPTSSQVAGAELRRHLLEALPAPDRDRWARDASLAATLEATWRDARASWPDVQLDPVRWIRFVAARLTVDEPPAAALGELCAGDLYLACAAIASESAAFAALDRHCITTVDAALRKMRLGGDEIDEIKQVVRVRLLTDDSGDGPALRKYSGRGRLCAWVRVVAVRVALDRLRKSQRGPAEVASLDDHLPALDLELELLKGSYQREFRAAFEDAMAKLEARDRNLLRYHLLDGLALERIGAIYRVHASTVSRWLAAARVTLLASTRAHLAERLDLAEDELGSVMALVESRLDLSISRLLRPADDDR